MTSRNEALAARAAMVTQMHNLPAAMRGRAQWLLWRLEEVPGRDGLQKVPYYVSGRKRAGDLGGERDRAALASFDDALRRLGGSMHFTGLGFAFLGPDADGLIAIDLDDTIAADGQMRAHHLEIIDACASYTERSPSGAGVHIIVAGQCDSFKHDGIGVEVYCGGRYFTCTGDRWINTPAEVQPIKGYALAYLQTLVQQAKDAAKAERARLAPVAPPAEGPAETPAPMAPPRAPAAGQQGNDFKRVNDAALASLGQWVPQALPGAKTWQDGYRVTSKALGRDLQEDLQLVPAGIMDFGEEQGLSPIDVVCKWVPGMQAPKDALHWLAQQLGISLARPRALRVVHPAAPDAQPDIGPDPPPAPPPEESTGGTPAKPRRGGRGRAAAGEGGGADRGGGGADAVSRLLEDFALVYGTDQVWDGTKRMTMQVKNLRLLFGAPYVNTWLAHPDRRVLLSEQIKFEPGQDLPPPCVNLFDGLPTVPVPCTESDCEPILDLLRHLTSLCCVRGPQGQLLPAGEQVFDQVIKWCALLVQRPGAKSRFAMVFHGPQGTGKNLFWDAFKRILGKYGKMVGQTELEDRFNGYMSGKLLLIGNEVVTRQELWHNKNKLKWVITDDEIPIRGMHQEVRWETNHANIVFLSNELQPVALERDDRRHLVVYTPAADDAALYARVVAFLADEGHAKFMHHLLQVDLGDFGEHTKPMMTEAKAALIELGLKPAERFAQEWLDGYLDLPVRPCSATQLFAVGERWCRMNGERSYANQATFTKTVERYVFERGERDGDGKRLPPALVYKQISLANQTGHRRTVRCWVPRGCGPVNGMTEGEWACEAIDDFERAVLAFGRGAGEPQQGGAT
jgi:putative DNA primase/helicase